MQSVQLSEAFSSLAIELQELLIKEGESGLAAQISTAGIVDRCRCGGDFCATFYVLPKPKAPYGPKHRSLVLDPEEGMLILDVLDEKLARVEVLYREEIRRKLLSLFP